MTENPVLAEYEQRAPYYVGRTPYVTEFIAEVLSAEHIGKVATVLDLCTGSGEIAAAMSPFADHIDAVDGAKNMLALAPTLSNVAYALMDINAPEFREFCRGKHYDLITIGRGVHFLDPSSLADLKSCLVDTGAIVILNSRPDGLNSWFAGYNEVLSEFGIGKRSTKGRGESNLRQAGYRMIRGYQRVYQSLVPIDAIAKLGLSYSDNEMAVKRVDEFTSKMRQKMLPFSNNGMLEFRLFNSIQIYRL